MSSGTAHKTQTDRPEIFELEVELLLEGIFQRYRADFRGYARASIHRRMQQALGKLGFASVSALQEKVLSDHETFDALLQYLTVPTTEMFRDPEYFLYLRREVVPLLATYPSIKVWVAGCSTGEEAYSMAILFFEEKLLDRTLFYATDINPRSLKRAQEGIYPLESLRKHAQNYQEAGGTLDFSSYYQTGYGAAVFARRLSERIVFADHSLATDNVFAEVQLISCRNVLIYFDRALQNRAFGLFYDSLGHRGFLGLGDKETPRFSNFEGHFEEIAPGHRIYRKRGRP